MLRERERENEKKITNNINIKYTKHSICINIGFNIIDYWLRVFFQWNDENILWANGWFIYIINMNEPTKWAFM